MLNQFFNDINKKILNWVVVALVLLSAFLFVKIVADLKRLPNVENEVNNPSTIMVNGESEVFVVPDTATFSFSVVEVGESVESAQELLNGKINKSLDLLKKNSVEEKDIKTTNYSVYPKYEWVETAVQCFAYPCPPVGGKNKMIGYELNQSVMVKVRDIKKVGDLVSQIGALNVSNISGVEFVVDNKEKYELEAREQAIKKAKDQAKKLAKQLGVRLGKILYFNDNLGYPQPYIMHSEGRGGVAIDDALKTSVPTGETKISSNVSITYEIK